MFTLTQTETKQTTATPRIISLEGPDARGKDLNSSLHMRHPIPAKWWKLTAPRDAQAAHGYQLTYLFLPGRRRCARNCREQCSLLIKKHLKSSRLYMIQCQGSEFMQQQPEQAGCRAHGVHGPCGIRSRPGAKCGLRPPSARTHGSHG